MANGNHALPCPTVVPIVFASKTNLNQERHNNTYCSRQQSLIRHVKTHGHYRPGPHGDGFVLQSDSALGDPPSLYNGRNDNT